MRHRLTQLLGRCSPGLLDLLGCRRADLSHDLATGLAVAAVALPAVGLYSSMHPLLANFFFGSSRQLIIGPDAATCALIAATVTPLAAGDAQAYIALSSAAGAVHGAVLHRRQLPQAGCAGGLPVAADPGRLPQRCCHQHCAGPVRSAVRLRGRTTGCHRGDPGNHRQVLPGALAYPARGHAGLRRAAAFAAPVPAPADGASGSSTGANSSCR